MRKPSPGCTTACLLLALALSPVAAGQVVSGQIVTTGIHPEPIEVRRGRPIEGLVVRLAAGARVAGRLIGLAEADLGHVEMVAWREGGWPPWPGLVRPDGSFEIGGLGPGRYSLQAVVRSTGQVERSSFEVEEGARLDGLEIDFSGVTLTVTASVLGRPLNERAWLDGPGVGGPTGARRLGPGRFAFAGLEPGRYRFSILASAAGAPDADGRFELPAVPAGTWRIVAGGGPWLGEALVEVPPGGTAGVALTLRRREPGDGSTAATSPR